VLGVAGDRERYARVVLAVPLPIMRDRLLTALRERSSYERLQWGAAAKLHVALDAPTAPAAVQSLDTAFWTWTARGPGGAPATVAASFAGGRRALEALEVGRGTAGWLAALRSLRPELAPGEHTALTRWSDDPFCEGSYACRPPGWSVRDDCEIAAPYGRIHVAGEHTAAEFCGTMEGALRSGARAAAEVLATAHVAG
jgi:monoamine oxidase